MPSMKILVRQDVTRGYAMSSLDNEHNPDSTVLTREASARQETVLVVDDTPDNITLITSLLKDLYRVKIAINGEKALKIAAADNVRRTWSCWTS